MKHSSTQARVFLVGAGPGNPKLITLRGLEVLRRADCIVFDHLIDSRLLDRGHPGAEKIYVGKQAGTHALPQKEISGLLVNRARSGAVVVRLKGGDPFVFGRGGEEALALQAAGIPFEVVPGVTAGTAALACAGIPATHRGLAAAVSFITGHEDPSKGSSDINWEAVAAMHGTLVFYMGIHTIEAVTAELLRFGKSGDTPAAVIRRGTMPEQQTVCGTLARIAEQAREAGIKPPGIIVVGDVVGLRSRLGWFEHSPLFGKTIVVTRARAQAGDMVAQLEELGADVIRFPTIDIRPLPSYDRLDRALQNIADYDWIVFTSVNGVQAFFERLQHLGSDSRALCSAHICAIGPATAERLQSYGLRADRQPAEFVSESIIDAFTSVPLSGKKVLLPRADIARAELREGLDALGAEVDDIAAYCTVTDNSAGEETLARIRSGGFDLVTFTSSSTVEHFVTLVGRNSCCAALQKACAACIGPVTEKTARAFGIKTAVRPARYTIPDLIEAIVNYYS